MDSQFNTLIRSFHDNYLQYKLTGTQGYKTSYEAAQEGIENILHSMQTSVDSGKSQIKDFYSSHAETNLRDSSAKTHTLRQSILGEDDRFKAAEMRSQASVVVPTQSLTPQYIAIGVLGTAILSLMVM
jgi:hypothetical protein